MNKFVICYNGDPLVIVENTKHQLPTDILKWYSDTYAFEYNKLTWSEVQTVTMP